MANNHDQINSLVQYFTKRLEGKDEENAILTSQDLIDCLPDLCQQYSLDEQSALALFEEMNLNPEEELSAQDISEIFVQIQTGLLGEQQQPIDGGGNTEKEDQEEEAQQGLEEEGEQSQSGEQSQPEEQVQNDIDQPFQKKDSSQQDIFLQVMTQQLQENGSDLQTPLTIDNLISAIDRLCESFKQDPPAQFAKQFIEDLNMDTTQNLSIEELRLIFESAQKAYKPELIVQSDSSEGKEQQLEELESVQLTEQAVVPQDKNAKESAWARGANSFKQEKMRAAGKAFLEVVKQQDFQAPETEQASISSKGFWIKGMKEAKKHFNKPKKLLKSKWLFGALAAKQMIRKQLQSEVLDKLNIKGAEERDSETWGQGAQEAKDFLKAAVQESNQALTEAQKLEESDQDHQNDNNNDDNDDETKFWSKNVEAKQAENKNSPLQLSKIILKQRNVAKNVNYAEIQQVLQHFYDTKQAQVQQKFDQWGGKVQRVQTFTAMKEIFSADLQFIIVQNISQVATSDFFETVRNKVRIEKYINIYQSEIRHSDEYIQSFSLDEFKDFVNFFLKENADINVVTVQSGTGVPAATNTNAKPNTVLQLRLAIKKYEKLLQQTRDDHERKIVTDSIETLTTKLNELQNKSSDSSTKQTPTQSNIQNRKGNFYQQTQKVAPGRNLSAQEQQLNVVQGKLREIFQFYCKKGFVKKPNATFEDIKHDYEHMSINQYIVFAKAFDVCPTHLKQEKLLSIFKCTSSSHKNLNFEDFLNVIGKLAEALFGTTEKGETLTAEQQLLEIYKFMHLESDQYRGIVGGSNGDQSVVPNGIIKNTAVTKIALQANNTTVPNSTKSVQELSAQQTFTPKSESQFSNNLGTPAELSSKKDSTENKKAAIAQKLSKNSFTPQLKQQSSGDKQTGATSNRSPQKDSAKSKELVSASKYIVNWNELQNSDPMQDKSNNAALEQLIFSSGNEKPDQQQPVNASALMKDILQNQQQTNATQQRNNTTAQQLGLYTDRGARAPIQAPAWDSTAAQQIPYLLQLLQGTLAANNPAEQMQGFKNIMSSASSQIEVQGQQSSNSKTNFTTQQNMNNRSPQRQKNSYQKLFDNKRNQQLNGVAQSQAVPSSTGDSPADQHNTVLQNLQLFYQQQLAARNIQLTNPTNASNGNNKNQQYQQPNTNQLPTMSSQQPTNKNNRLALPQQTPYPISSPKATGGAQGQAELQSNLYQHTPMTVGGNNVLTVPAFSSNQPQQKISSRSLSPPQQMYDRARQIDLDQKMRAKEQMQSMMLRHDERVQKIARKY